MAESEEVLGWQVGMFAVERLSPDEKSGAGSSAIWECYRDWCAERKLVPLAFAVFHAEFEKVAEAAGIGRRQVGAHVAFEGLRLERGKGL